MNALCSCGKYMSFKAICRSLIGFIALSVLGMFPLLWIIGSYVPDRLDLYVANVRSAERTSSFEFKDGNSARVADFCPCSEDVQRIKAYFNAGCSVENLEFGFKNGPMSFSIEKMTIMHRCIVLRTLNAHEFLIRYDILGDGKVVQNAHGGLDVEVSGDKIWFRPKKDVTAAWGKSFGSDQRLIPFLIIIEILLLLLSFAGVFLVDKDKDSLAVVFLKSICVAFVAILLFVVVLPVQSYLVNRCSFPFSIKMLLVEALPRALVGVIILTAIMVVLHFFFSYIVHVIVVAVVVFEYLLTGVMSIGLPSLNGDLIWWSRLGARGWIEMVIGFCIFAVFIFFHKFICRYLYAFLGIILLLIFVSIADVRVEKISPVGNEYICNTKDIAYNVSYSAKRNILMFILDAASTASCAKEFEENVELREMFQGFILCKNNLSMGGCTAVGLPGLMTGCFQTVLEDDKDYAYSFFGTNSIAMITAAANIPTYFVPGLGRRGMCSHVNMQTNMVGSVDDSEMDSVFELRDSEGSGMNLDEIVKFRTAPLMIKNLLLTLWTLGGSQSFDYMNESILYPMLANGMIVSDISCAFHVYHTIGMHLPITIDRNGVVLARPHNTLEGLLNVTYAKLHKLGELLNSYRRRGIYDNSLIIVCGDHGNPLELLDRKVGDPALPVVAFSLLMIKPMGVNSGFLVDNHTPTSHCGIKRLIEKEIGEGPIKQQDAISLLSESNRVFRDGVNQWEVDDTMTSSRVGKWRP